MEEGMTGKELSDRMKADLDSDRFQGKYDASIKRKLIFIASMVVVTIITLMISVCLGSVDVPLEELFRVLFHPLLPDLVPAPSEDYYSDFILRGRLPRAVLVILTGCSLGIAGMMMQTLLRNPLVSPFTLGVSTAASFGAALAIILGNAIFGLSVMGTTFTLAGDLMTVGNIVEMLFAFGTAMLSIVIVMRLSRDRNSTRSMVILAGVVISYLFQAGIMAAKYFSDDEQLREITTWIMGSMANASWGADILIAPIVIACIFLLFRDTMDLNALSAGDDVASSLGVEVEELRKRGLLLCTLMTSICLAFTGVIGFIGLMAPHICRMIIGNDARFLMPASGIMGITILSVSDLFCRLVIRPGELPTGIVLYVVGGLFFIWIISSRKWRGRL